MKFVISLFQDEDGIFIAECPAIPGCVSQGQVEQGGQGEHSKGDQGMFGSAGCKGNAFDGGD